MANIFCRMMEQTGSSRHNATMKMRLEQLLKDIGKTQAWLAEQADVNPGYLSQIKTGQKQGSPDVLRKIADALDVHIGALYVSERRVPVVGRVGAGAEVQLVDAFAKGDGLYKVSCPDDLPEKRIVAVEVEGMSMAPLIEPGDILFFTRHFVGVDDCAINRVAILCTEDGRALVKLLKKGREPGLFDLYSANNEHAPEYGIRLSWAAPMRRHISRQDIDRSQA